jgi:hypothetical protein
MLTESEQLELANKAADFLPCTLEYVYNLKVIINTIVQIDLVEDSYLKNTSDLISIISRLLQAIQYRRNQVLYSYSEHLQQAEKSPDN